MPYLIVRVGIFSLAIMSLCVSGPSFSNNLTIGLPDSGNFLTIYINPFYSCLFVIAKFMS